MRTAQLKSSDFYNVRKTRTGLTRICDGKVHFTTILQSFYAVVTTLPEKCDGMQSTCDILNRCPLREMTVKFPGEKITKAGCRGIR